MIELSDFSARYRASRTEIDACIRRVLERGWFVLGEEGRAFEEEFARYLGVKHVVGVNSGTDALFLSLRALGVGAGDDVITVANTATPTVSAIRMAGARPVFVDIDARSFAMDPAGLRAAITRRAKAVIPVHLFGYPAPVDEIVAIARRAGLPVVEDVAQATGARLRGRCAGTFGRTGCFSFYPTKNLGAFGDGGAVATDSARVAASLRALRNYGEKSKYNNTSEGVNSRLDELQAAVLRWGLSRLEAWNGTRNKLARVYLDELAGAPIGLPPAGDATHQPVWHLFVIQVAHRKALREHLNAHGVQTAVHYPRPIYRQRAYRFLGYTRRDLPVTARVMSRIVSLPLHPEMTVSDARAVGRAVRSFHGDRNAS